MSWFDFKKLLFNKFKKEKEKEAEDVKLNQGLQKSVCDRRRGEAGVE